WIVTIEERASEVFRLLELTESFAALFRNLVGCTQSFVHDRCEVSIGEDQDFFGAIVDMFATQEDVKVHLTQANGMGLIIAVADRWNRINSGLICHRG